MVKLAQMWFDALLGHQWPRLARWTVVVVDRFDGQERHIESTRFRWRSSAERWIAYARTHMIPPGPLGATVQYAVRPLVGGRPVRD